jgi:hypothetical protein
MTVITLLHHPKTRSTRFDDYVQRVVSRPAFARAQARDLGG